MVSQSDLLSQLGNPATPKTVDRLHRFAFLPTTIIERLRTTPSPKSGAKTSSL